MLVWLSLLVADAPPVSSGPTVGEKPAPYSFVVSTGVRRGQLHCFICEAAEKPFIIFFARQPNDTTGELASRCDTIIREARTRDARGWVTFLQPDQSSFDNRALLFGRKHKLGTMATGVFEDIVGPPDYKIAAEADLTIVMARGEKVIRTMAFTANGLDKAGADSVANTWRDLLKEVSKP